MKRFLSALLSCLFMMTALCIGASAESGSLSMQYVPRTQRGALFYLDISCDTPVSAAVFVLDCDPTIAEYRDVFCDDDNACVMGNADGGSVKIAYSHRSGASGRLFRVAMKALSKGTVRFTLQMTQAVDAQLDDLTGVSDGLLEVTFGKDDVPDFGTMTVEKHTEAPSKSSGKSKKPTEASEKKAYSGMKSERSQSDADEDEEKLSDDEPEYSRDLTGKDKLQWLTLGAAAALTAVLLAAGGFILGRKMRRKPVRIADDTEEEELSEPAESLQEKSDDNCEQ